MSRRIFVYGTLKEGFPNAHINGGERVPGRFMTINPMVLWVVGDDHVPWLLNEALDPQHRVVGRFVEGELYDVPEHAMPRMDALEDIGKPGGYDRTTIEVCECLVDGSFGQPQPCEVYVQRREHLQGRAVQAGPLAVYTQALASRYRN